MIISSHFVVEKIMKKRRITLLLALVAFSACALPELPQLTVAEGVNESVYAASLEAVKASLPDRVVIPAPPDCTLCHIEKSEYKSPFYTLPLNFSHKSHSALGIACLFCHRAASSSREIDDDLMPVGHFFKNEKDDEAPDLNPCRVCHLYSSEFGKKDKKIPGQCIDCHSGYPKRKVEPETGYYLAGLLNNHNVHIEKGIPCLRCHVDFDKLEATVSKFTPTRKLCEECHGKGVEGRNLDTLVPPRGVHLDAEALFMRNCAPCHGDDGKGTGKVSGFFSADLTPRDLTDPVAMGKRSDEQLFDVIYHGGPKLMLSERMPAWRGLLTEMEVKILVKYVRGLSAE